VAGEREADVTDVVCELSREGATRQATAETLFPIVYDELRRLIAHRELRRRGGGSLRTTGLIHEAYLKLVDQTRADWKGKTHFFAVGARVMRRLLVDHARERGAHKRGAGWRRVTLSGILDSAPAEGLGPERLLDLNAALERLAELDEREARVVTLRSFGGLTVEQVAEVLGVSRRTVDNDWRHAQAWLRNELSNRGGMG
jgi:RNA polymerase sigma-70 factor (ECF subfamily)